MCINSFLSFHLFDISYNSMYFTQDCLEVCLLDNEVQIMGNNDNDNIYILKFSDQIGSIDYKTILGYVQLKI